MLGLASWPCTIMDCKLRVCKLLRKNNKKTLGRKQKKLKEREPMSTLFFLSQCGRMYNTCILLRNHQTPYMENFHNHPLSWTIPDYPTARVERQVSIGSPRHIPQESSLNCERRIMTGGEFSFASLWDLFEAPAHTYFCSYHCFCSCHASLLAVHTCCNLHAEYAGGCSFGNVHGERAIRESGAGNGADVSKMRSATLDRMGKIFWRITLKHLWSLIVNYFHLWIFLLSLLLHSSQTPSLDLY